MANPQSATPRPPAPGTATTIHLLVGSGRMPVVSATLAERALLEHRWAVWLNLPADANHAARTARWLVGNATYARLPAPTLEHLTQAAELLEAAAEAVAGRIEAEMTE